MYPVISHPGISEFIQPDTLIPLQSQGTQAWDRYAAMNNNPVRYADPSGHCIEDLCIGEGILLFTALAMIAEEAAPEIEAFVSEEGPTIAETATSSIEEAQPILEKAVTDGGQIVQEASSAIAQTSNQLLRYIHPNNILPDGGTSSLAFKDATMSVFDESLGATPKMVLDIMSKGTGQGTVYGLDPNEVQNIPGVTSIESELGATGNSVLNAAHQVINNVGTKAVARAIRDVAQYLIGER